MKKEFKDIFWYLEKVGGSEVFYFETTKEAYDFGHSVRDNEGQKVEVEIGEKHVRIRLVEETAIQRKK
jgi:hypothetical protein